MSRPCNKAGHTKHGLHIIADSEMDWILTQPAIMNTLPNIPGKKWLLPLLNRGTAENKLSCSYEQLRHGLRAVVAKLKTQQAKTPSRSVMDMLGIKPRHPIIVVHDSPVKMKQQTMLDCLEAFEERRTKKAKTKKGRITKKAGTKKTGAKKKLKAMKTKNKKSKATKTKNKTMSADAASSIKAEPQTPRRPIIKKEPETPRRRIMSKSSPVARVM